MTEIKVPSNWRFRNLIGSPPFGRLTVLEYAGKRNGRTEWKCQCSCGNVVNVRSQFLVSGHTQSCGCFMLDQIQKSNVKHGHDRVGKRTAEYRCWASMNKRCSNQNSKEWHNYGGRGISVCDEWIEDFDAFLAHIGPRPSSRHSIDRFPNNNGNYEPGNVRWATQKEQSRNTRVNRLITIDGMTKCLVELCEIYGITENAVSNRLKSGWSIEDAFKNPIQKRKTNRKMISFNGKTQSVADWAREVGLAFGTLAVRLQKGWPIEKALTTPTVYRGQKSKR